jgi:hypothetical protein
VRPSNFNDAAEILRLLVECIPEFRQCRNERLVDFSHSGNMHSRWEAAVTGKFMQSLNPPSNLRVITTLAHVNVIIWVDWFL